MHGSRLQPRVFVSYAHEDQPLAHALVNELNKRGASVWFDETALQPGDRIAVRVAEALRTSDIFLLLVSPASTESPWVRRELDIALRSENRTRVVPVRIGGAKVPTSLADVLYIDAEPEAMGSVAEQVLRAAEGASPTLEHDVMAGEVQSLLDGLNVDWYRRPAIAGVQPDFLVETPTGKRLVLEVKNRLNPSLLDAVDARGEAARFREVTGADDAVVVFPSVETGLGTVGIVGLPELGGYLRDFLAGPKRPTTSASERPEPEMQACERTVFASMPFAPEYEDVYWVAMTAAAEAIRATCVRVDREDFDGDIPATIAQYIETSIAVIADLSESKPDVLYELGYARRNGSPLVQICSTPLADLPFNVRNINTLAYKPGQTHELREPLTERLRAVLEDASSGN